MARTIQIVEPQFRIDTSRRSNGSADAITPVTSPQVAMTTAIAATTIAGTAAVVATASSTDNGTRPLRPKVQAYSIPHLLKRSQTGNVREMAPKSFRIKAGLRRFAYKFKALFGKEAAPTPEEAHCPCFLYPPDGWRFCEYDEHVDAGIRAIRMPED